MAKGKSGITSAPIAPPPADNSIKSASEAKSFGELQQYAKDELGLKVGYSLHDIDLGTVKDAVSGIETLMKEFPQAKDSFRYIAGNAKGANAFAQASFDGGIDLNGTKYKDLIGLEKSYTASVASHYPPEGTTVKDITVHEAGHILERALIEKKYPMNISGEDKLWNHYYASDAWNKCTLAKDIVSRACKAAKKTPEGKGLLNGQLIKQVSGYAYKNKSECLAECVADYVANGSKAKPLSIAVWKELKKELG